MSYTPIWIVWKTMRIFITDYITESRTFPDISIPWNIHAPNLEKLSKDFHTLHKSNSCNRGYFYQTITDISYPTYQATVPLFNYRSLLLISANITQIYRILLLVLATVTHYRILTEQFSNRARISLNSAGTSAFTPVNYIYKYLFD